MVAGGSRAGGRMPTISDDRKHYAAQMIEAGEDYEEIQRVTGPDGLWPLCPLRHFEPAPRSAARQNASGQRLCHENILREGSYTAQSVCAQQLLQGQPLRRRGVLGRHRRSNGSGASVGSGRGRCVSAAAVPHQHEYLAKLAKILTGAAASGRRRVRGP